MARSYELKRRAESQKRTRQRIVEAAVDLHESVGPTATTMSDVAERAQVGRVTVYRHFGDETELLRACSGHYFERHPAPDPERWREIEDPVERLRTALGKTYAYHRETEEMVAHALEDLRRHEVMEPYLAHWQRATEVLLEPWRARGRRRTLLRAGIALALSFETWRQLVREHGLTEEQAIELGLRLASHAPRGADGYAPRRRTAPPARA